MPGSAGLLPVGRKRSRLRRHAHHARRPTGAVLPFVTLWLLIVAAFIGFTTDVMRTAQAARMLQFASQSAALYAYSFASDQSGFYNEAQARSSITSRVLACGDGGDSSWNTAPAGPTAGGGLWRTPVRFDSSGVTFVANPDDQSELLLQVRAGRDGADALKMFFLPAVYAINLMLGEPLRPGIDRASPYRTAEVVGQPASRVGAAAPLSAEAGTRAAELIGCGVLPLAVSNEQFRQAALSSETTREYDVDLVSSGQPAGAAVAAGHLRGAFVNVARSGSSASYYGPHQGNNGIDQLIGLLLYFAREQSPGVLAPAVVERGAAVGAFDPFDSDFTARKQEIVDAVARLPDRFYIVPVLESDPLPGMTSRVAGFARLRLVRAVSSSGSEFAIRFRIGESVPMRNASAANGEPAVPGTAAAVLPQPEFPFVMRTWIPTSNGVSTRPRGVVLAPALSPRLIPQVN